MNKVHTAELWEGVRKAEELDNRLTHECIHIIAQLQHLIQSLRQSHLQLLAQFGLESAVIDNRRYSQIPNVLPLKSNEHLWIMSGGVIGTSDYATSKMGEDIHQLYVMRSRLKQLLPIVMAAVESEQPEYSI